MLDLGSIFLKKHKKEANFQTINLLKITRTKQTIDIETLLVKWLEQEIAAAIKWFRENKIAVNPTKCSNTLKQFNFK